MNYRLQNLLDYSPERAAENDRRAAERADVLFYLRHRVIGPSAFVIAVAAWVLTAAVCAAGLACFAEQAAAELDATLNR